MYSSLGIPLLNAVRTIFVCLNLKSIKLKLVKLTDLPLKETEK